MKRVTLISALLAVAIAIGYFGYVVKTRLDNAELNRTCKRIMASIEDKTLPEELRQQAVDVLKECLDYQLGKR